MNVACTNCPAKYGIPDEKVKGRKVRITCKRCGAPIVVDGTKLGGAPTAAEQRARRQKTMMGGLEAPLGAAPSPEDFKFSSHPPSVNRAPPPREPWTVAITEENQREMTTEQVADAFIRGLIDAETFIWREGMEDWLTAFEIPEIADALRARGIKPSGGASVPPAMPTPSPPDAAPRAPEASRAADAKKTKESRPPTAWREPGRWDGSPGDLSFDDVTVAMAAPKAQELLDAISTGAEQERAPAQPRAQQPSDHGFDEDERTVVADSARLGLSLPSDSATSQPTPVFAAAAAPMPQTTATPLPKASSTPLPKATTTALPTATPLPKATGTPLPKAAAPASAARAKRETEPGVDLFSAAARAGSEEEQIKARERMPSGTSEARARMPSGTSEANTGSLTGARNESSVLFSLDALAKKQQPKGSGPKPPRKEDAAALLLAPSPGASTADEKQPDSIMRLNAGGPFGAMTVPDVNAPAPPSVPPQQAQDPILASITPPDKAEKKPGGGRWVGLGILLVLGAAGVGAYVTGFYKQFTSAAPATPAAEATPSPAPSPAQSVTTPEPTATTTAAPVESASATAAPPASASAPTTAAAPGRAAPAKPGKPAAAASSSAPPAPAAEASGPPFDKDAASSALSAAAAQAQSSCPSGEGPKVGKVAVTFANSGRATQALVTGELAGTSAGGCVAKIFRSVKIPAFSGDSVRVSKSVSVQ